MLNARKMYSIKVFDPNIVKFILPASSYYLRSIIWNKRDGWFDKTVRHPKKTMYTYIYIDNFFVIQSIICVQQEHKHYITSQIQIHQVSGRQRSGRSVKYIFILKNTFLIASHAFRFSISTSLPITRSHCCATALQNNEQWWVLMCSVVPSVAPR